MFARILDCQVKPEKKKEEFVKVIKNEILPILQKQGWFSGNSALLPREDERGEGDHNQSLGDQSGCREI